ncbi:MAG: phospho-sugar mutase [Mycoplasmoidaceae bacterium]
MNKIFNDWLNSDRVSNDLKEEMKKLSKEEIDLYFSDKKTSFGTAGIRQKMGAGTRRFNTFTYEQIAVGYAKHILKKCKNPKVIIGHDNRFFSDEFTMVCAEVLSSFGIKVLIIKDNLLKATPIISFLISYLKLDGGIIITASHNPKDYNGFKVYKETGGQILNDDAESIIKKMPANNKVLGISYVSNYDLISEVDDRSILEYFNQAKRCLINTNTIDTKHFPIIFTSHHGTASDDLPYFLYTLGYTKVIKVKEQCYPDCNFTNSPNSNPEDKSSFELSLKYARTHNADIMLGVDPDADRLAVAIKTKEGSFKYISGNEMGIIFTYYCLKNKNYNKTPFIVSTFVSTNLIDRIAADYGCKIFRTGTGFKCLSSVIEEKYKDMDFVVAFEEAIGSLNSIINRDKDSYQAAALALEIFDFYRKQNIDFKELLENEIYPKYGYWRGETISFLIKDLNWVEKSEAIMESFRTTEIDEICGMKLLESRWNDEGDCLEWIFENDNSVRFRKSGTEPKFKAYFNMYGSTLEKAEENFIQFKREIKELMNSL